MTIIIDLAPEEETELSNAASREGMEPSEYAHRLLVEQLGLADRVAGPRAVVDKQPPFYARATPEEWKREFEAWSQSHDQTSPLLSDEALRRESLYEDRGM